MSYTIEKINADVAEAFAKKYGVCIDGGMPQTATGLEALCHRVYNKGWADCREKMLNKRWIPCSERLPEELTPVNVTWVNRKPAIYYENIKDIPFTATAVYCNEKWFWWSSICEDILAEYGRNDAEMVDEEVEILAWQPLPEPYKE